MSVHGYDRFADTAHRSARSTEVVPNKGSGDALLFCNEPTVKKKTLMINCSLQSIVPETIDKMDD